MLGGEKKLIFKYDLGDREETYSAKFEGVLNNLSRRYHETDSDVIRDELERYMTIQQCPGCHGARLRAPVVVCKLSRTSRSPLRHPDSRHIKILTSNQGFRYVKWHSKLSRLPPHPAPASRFPPQKLTLSFARPPLLPLRTIT